MKRNKLVVIPIIFLMTMLSMVFVSAALTDNIVGYWKFDEQDLTGSGTIIDAVTGSLHNGTNYGTTNVTGKINTAYNFTGGANVINISNLAEKGDYSVIAWAKMEQFRTNNYVFLFKPNETFTNGFYINSAGANFYNGSTITAPLTHVYRNLWYLIALTKSGTNYSVYIFPENDTTGYSTASGVTTDIDVTGIEFGTTLAFDFEGIIDEGGMWSRALTTSELIQLYANGTGFQYPFSTGTTTTSIKLVSPANATQFASTSVNLSTNYSMTGSDLGYNWTNTTFLIWHENGTLFNSTYVDLGNNINVTTSSIIAQEFSIGNYTWNVYGCFGNSTFSNCSFSDGGNRTIEFLNYIINSVTYNSITTETFSESFVLNLSLRSGISLTSANFTYNGTTYSPDISSTSNIRVLTNNLEIPQVTTELNVSFYWTLVLSSGTINTTIYNQTIQDLNIDDCSVNTHLILNYTIYDEDDRYMLNASYQNTSSDVYVKLSGDVSGTEYTYHAFNSLTNPVQICANETLIASQNYRLDSEIKFTANDYATEYHYIENYTLNSTFSPQNTSLYLLVSNRSQEFSITFKDNNLIPVNSALVYLTRQYLSLGQFLTIEISKTDADGKTISHFVLNDEVYTAYVYKDGVLLATFENVRAYCPNAATTECKINLNQKSSTTNPSSFLNYLGVIGTQSYNDTTKIYTFSFSTTSGSTKTINVSIYNYDPYLNTTICSEELTSSSGSISCTIPSTYYNSTILVNILVDGELYSQNIFQVSISRANDLDASRFILAFLLIVTIPLLAFTSGPMTLIFFIVGLVIAGGLALIDWGGFIGPFSAFLWIVVAAIVLLVKASKRREQ